MLAAVLIALSAMGLATATTLKQDLIVSFVSTLKVGHFFRFEVASTENGNKSPPQEKWSTIDSTVGAVLFNDTDQFSLIYWEAEGQPFKLYNATLAADPGVCHMLWNLTSWEPEYEGTAPEGARLDAFILTEVQTGPE